MTTNHDDDNWEYDRETRRAVRPTEPKPLPGAYRKPTPEPQRPTLRGMAIARRQMRQHRKQALAQLRIAHTSMSGQ